MAESKSIWSCEFTVDRAVPAERIYAKAVLERVVATIKFLAERNLAFRGNDQVIGSPSNGNFLGTLELLSQFDPFLAAHLEKYGNKGEWSILTCLPLHVPNS